MQYFGEDYLMHHGVKGQKWGVRRYQNADGSLTEKGKKRVERLNKQVDKTFDKQVHPYSMKFYKASQKSGHELTKYYDKGGNTPKNLRRLAKASTKHEEAANRYKMKIDYERKLSDIRKSEIQQGFNYYERSRNRNMLIGAMLWPTPLGGSTAGMIGGYAIARGRYDDTYQDRKDAKRQYKEKMKRLNKDARKNRKKYIEKYEQAYADGREKWG